MFWTVSNRVQIQEDYKTLELNFNRTIELPYTQHEADCENLMGVINRWNERKSEATAGMNSSKGKRSDRFFQCYLDDYREAKMCYEYNLRELDHLIRHNAVTGAERIHFIYESAAREAVEGMCEACDKIDTTNAILKRPWLAQD